jgi:hypothetical protein
MTVAIRDFEVLPEIPSAREPAAPPPPPAPASDRERREDVRRTLARLAVRRDRLGDR